MAAFAKQGLSAGDWVTDPHRGQSVAAGVSLPDVMAREGFHPGTPEIPFTPGWDLVGVVDRLGEGVEGFATGQALAAMPIHGAYAQFVRLPPSELVPLPAGLVTSG